MARNETFSITTSQTTVNQGKGFVVLGPEKITRTSTSSDTKRVLNRREKFDKGADNVLGIFGRIEMIGITIITLAIAPVFSSSIAQPSYLTSMYPNYQTVHENNEITNPWETDYIQYGDQAVSNIVGVVTFLGGIGSFAHNLWTNIVSIFGGEYVVESNGFTYNADKLLKEQLFGLIGSSLAEAQDYWTTLTPEAQANYASDYENMIWLVQVFYWSPTELEG